jgi:hypothetical protein
MLIEYFKTWKPKKSLVDKLTKEQIERINYENNHWPTGKEGGQLDSSEGMRSSSFTIAWALLSIVAIGMPVIPNDNRKQYLHTFLLSLGNVLPCKACRTSFDSNIVASGYDPKIHLQSRQAFVRFIHKLHNTVNIMLGKPLFPYHDFRNFYEVLRARCVPSKGTRKGSCEGGLYKNDKKASCIIKIISEEEAKRQIKKNGGRISMSAECRVLPNSDQIINELRFMTLNNTSGRKKHSKRSKRSKRSIYRNGLKS